MTNMDRRQVLKGAVGLGVAGALYGPAAALADDGNGTRYRWDITNVLGGCIDEGGSAASKANDNTRISLTGSGTFRDGRDCSKKVTGGGTWGITPTGPTPPAGSGTYKVTRFVSFELAPGALPPAANDCIGNREDGRAGRLTVAIRFSDGSEGVLEVGCRLPGSPGVPGSEEIMEGITATKGFVTFWSHEEPVAGVEGNRTIFHVLRKSDDDDD